MKSFNKYRTIPDPNEIVDKKKQLTRFHLAIKKHDDLAVSVMLKQGADLNKTTGEGTPPLSLALKSNSDKIAHLICDEATYRGVQTLESVINQSTDDALALINTKKTPLFFAIQYCDNINLFKRIVDLGADLTVNADKQYTVMDHAIHYQRIDAIKYLSQSGHIDLNPHIMGDRKSYIAKSIECHYFDGLKALIDLGADMNIALNLDEGSDIMACLLLENTEMFYYMLAHGADIMLRDEKTKTSSLHLSYTPEIAEILLENGAGKYINDISLPTEETPIMVILETYKDTASAEILIDAGANINDKNAHGFTLMHYAAYLNDIDFFESLILKGAYNDEKNDYGDTPLVCAIESGSLHITKRLISLGADKAVSGDICETDLLGVAAQSGNVDLGRFLIEELGFDVNKKNLREQTALMTAVYYNHGGFLNLLLEHKADASALDKNDSNALHYLAKASQTIPEKKQMQAMEIAKILVKNGVSVHQKNKDNGKIPYDLSISRQSNQSLILYLEKETYPSGRGGWVDLRFA